MVSYFSVLKRINKSLLGLAFLWSLIWFSLNAESRDFDGSLISIIHAIRLYLPYIAAFIALGWMVIDRSFTAPARWQVGLVGYALVVILSGFLHEVPLGYIHFHASMICAVIVTLLGSALAKKHDDINELDPAIALAISGIAILAAVLAAFFLRDIYQAINLGIIQGYRIQPSLPDQFGMETPRPTGNARSAAILLIACLAVYSMNIARARLTLHIAAICLAILLFYQSRGALLSLGVVCLFAFLAIPKNKAPPASALLRFSIISLVYWALLIAGLYISTFVSIDNSISVDSVTIFRDFTPEYIGSGRLGHWQNGMIAFMQSPFIGFGSQADRIHIDHNVSSIFLYTLICGGVIGALFAVMAIYRPVIMIVKLLSGRHGGSTMFSHQLIPFAAPIFLFLSARGIFENSYALFNIDFLLAVPVIWILNPKTVHIEDE